MCDKYVRILHTGDRFVRMWMSNESVTSVKDLNVFVTHVKNSCECFTDVTNTCESFTSVKDSHEYFTSVIRSFWGDAIIRKIKDGRRRPCFSTGTCTTRHWGEHCDQDLKKKKKKKKTSSLGGGAMTSLSMGNFTKSEPGTKRPSTDRNCFLYLHN